MNQEESPPVEESVREWLTKTGFPLEMRVAREARRHRYLLLEQSRYFVDPDTGKVRETDVFVGMGPSAGEPGAHVALVVECKSKPTPWVVFDDGDLPSDNPVQRLRWAISAAPVNENGDGLGLRLKEDAFTGNTLLRPSRVGIGILAKEHTSGRDSNSAWDAARSVVAAARGLATEFESRGLSDDDTPLLMFPVLVTSGSLLRAYLSGDEMEVESVDRAEVIVRTHSPNAYIRCLVVREQAWPLVLQDAEATIAVLAVEA